MTRKSAGEMKLHGVVQTHCRNTVMTELWSGGGWGRAVVLEVHIYVTSRKILLLYSNLRFRQTFPTQLNQWFSLIVEYMRESGSPSHHACTSQER